MTNKNLLNYTHSHLYVKLKASFLGAEMLFFQSFNHQLELRLLGPVVSILLA